LILIFCGIAGPVIAGGGAAKGGTAHVLFIKVERLVSNGASSTIGKYA
jgi:hypothetical protein